MLLIGILILLAIWLINMYNGLVGLKNQVLNGWKQIDVQLKRRHDLIPNLVETVKGYLKYEQETLNKVIQARNQAISTAGVADTANKEQALTGALNKLLAVVENYPDLKGNQNVMSLQEELTSTENKISYARQFYNDITTKYNTRQQTFPNNLFAAPFGFKPAELFEVTDAADREVPKVNITI